MPGITGILTRDVAGDEITNVETMLRVTLHERFYTHGTYANPDAGAFIGYAALPGSFADCMPLWNQDGSLVMFLTGENYVDEDALSGSKPPGAELNAGRANCLMPLYEKDPEQFFSHLNGWINGIVIDLRGRRVVLFNDRCGMRRLYYFQADDAFYFASEAKSLLAVLPAVRDLDPRSVADFFTFDCVVENRTFFRGVHLLPPGSAWEFTRAGVRKRTYFDWQSCEAEPPMNEEKFEGELTATLERTQPRYFRGGRVGLALTGGLDTPHDSRSAQA